MAKNFTSVTIFDLDGTVIDSAHRTPNKPDRTLDLERYFALKTRENIFRDTLLPLARVFQSRKKQGSYVVVCTARNMNQDDHDYLAANELVPHKLISRPDGDMSSDGPLKIRGLRRLLNLRQFANLPVVMFDDAPKVLTAIRGMGIPVLQADWVNERLG